MTKFGLLHDMKILGPLWSMINAKILIFLQISFIPIALLVKALFLV